MNFYGYEIDPEKLPRHVGIIMDGNGRWAVKRGLDRSAGHEKGFAALRRLMDFNRRLKAPIITVYAFSTENWKRPAAEVSFLMELLARVIPLYTEELRESDVRIRVTGTREGISEELNRIIDNAIARTSHCKQFTFNIALNYGGRREIADAVKGIVRDVRDGKLLESDVGEDTIGRYLYSPDLPDADLIIRTSGELRMSNFLLWQSAYSELWFTNKLWPDFRPKDFCKAVYDYQNRKRRFGNVK